MLLGAILLIRSPLTGAGVSMGVALGVTLALDDFGTGYSCLRHLQSLPFDKIKIDRSFISDFAKPEGSSAIIKAVVAIASERNIATTAEGVETNDQRE